MATQGQLVNLDKLPSLVTENITQYLDLDTIKSLRLSSKELSGQCIGPRFKHFYHHQKTDLTEGSLKSLRALASHPTLGPAVKELTIMATVYDTSELESVISTGEREVVEHCGMITTSTTEECTEEELRAAQSDLEWLQAQQKKEPSDVLITDSLVSAMSGFGKLESLSLDAGVTQGRNNVTPPTRGKWHEIWARAQQVYTLTMTATARSRVAVDTLSVYRSTLRCSVPICHITAHILSLDTADDLHSTGRTIKNLAISLSPEITADFNRETLKGESGYSIASLLGLMPNLETLNVHSYCPRKGEGVENDQVLEDVAQTVHLPSLKKCSWHGIYFNEQTMLQFLKKYPQILHLTLEEVHLTEGSWEPIFEQLSSNMPSLASLHLSNIWATRGSLVSLEPVWNEPSRQIPRSHYYSYGGGQLMVHTQQFDTADIKRGLRFKPKPQGNRPLGSGALMRWRRMRMVEYGSP